jgi:hypothetical protein
MDEMLTRVWENLIGRVHGPLTFRFIIQPLIACMFAVRAGWKDARAGRAPYFWAIFTNPAHRHELLRQGWKDVGKVFVLAIVLDVIYQLIVLRWVYPGEALIIACVLALVPYLLVRGPVTRVARLSRSMPQGPGKAGDGDTQQSRDT